LGLFGAFLLFYERFQYCAGGCRLEPRTRAAAWTLLLLGAVLIAAVIALRLG
jgi:hypothetical protein